MASGTLARKDGARITKAEALYRTRAIEQTLELIARDQIENDLDRRLAQLLAERVAHRNQRIREAKEIAAALDSKGSAA